MTTARISAAVSPDVPLPAHVQLLLARPTVIEEILTTTQQQAQQLARCHAAEKCVGRKSSGEMGVSQIPCDGIVRFAGPDFITPQITVGCDETCDFIMHSRIMRGLLPDSQA